MPDLPATTKKVILELESKNLSLAAKEISKLSKEISSLMKQNMTFSKAFDKSFNKGIKNTKKLTVKQELYNKALKRTMQLFGKWNSQLNQTAKSLAKGIISIKSVEILQKYNLQMIKATVGARQHNISLKSLNSTFSSLSKSIHMTTMEVAELFNSFRADAPIVNEKMFAKLSKNIEKVVGPSKEAVDAMMKEVIALQNLYPGLIKDTITLTKEGTKRIREQMNFAIHEGKFSAAQARRINDYLGQQSEVTKEKRAELATLKEFEQHSFRISMLLANALLPALKKIGTVFEKNKDSIKKFFDFLGWLIGKAIKHWEIFLGMWGISKLALPIMGKRMMGRAAGRAAGAAAGGAAGGGIGGAMMSSAKWLVAHPAVIAIIVAAAAAAAIVYYANELRKAKNVGAEAKSKFGRQSEYFNKRADIFNATVKGSEERKQQLAGLDKKYGKISTSYHAVKEKEKQKKADEEQAKINAAKMDEVKAIELFEKRLQIVSKAVEGQAKNVAVRMKQMQITGQIRPGTIEGDVGKTISRYKQEQQLVIKRLTAARETLKTQEKNEASLQAQSETQNTINKLAAIEYGLQEKIYNVVKNISKVMETRIKLSQLDAQFANMRVQLADNYAIGVGASVKLRMQEYEANKKLTIDLEKKLSLIDREIATTGITDKLRSDRKEAEIEIYQIMMKQAQITRSIRDGWVEAVASMNTGAGTFSKIVMDQTKNTAQALRTARGAAVYSARSGGLTGYGTPERFTSRAGFVSGTAGVGTGFGRGQAYQTTNQAAFGQTAMEITHRAIGKFYEALASQVKVGLTSALIDDKGGFRTAALAGSQNIVINIYDKTGKKSDEFDALVSNNSY